MTWLLPSSSNWRRRGTALISSRNWPPSSSPSTRVSPSTCSFYLPYARFAAVLTFPLNYSSANPAAFLASRLTTYLRRPWTALAPCPLAKELVPVHPRKVYYYLTTTPRQPIPDASEDTLIPPAVVTPSASSVDQDDADALARERSPSPEVDLSSPDFDDDSASQGTASKHAPSFSVDHRHHSRLIRSHQRANSPPLERDEREFTLTASAVRERASEAKSVRPEEPENGGNTISDTAMDGISSGSMDEDPLSSASGDRIVDGQYGDYFAHMDSRGEDQDLDEAAAVALFGTSPSPSLSSTASSASSSPSMAPDAEDIATPVENGPSKGVSTVARPIAVPGMDVDMKMSHPKWGGKLSFASRDMDLDLDMMTESWIELQSPETVEVDELDAMFGEI